MFSVSIQPKLCSLTQWLHRAVVHSWGCMSGCILLHCFVLGAAIGLAVAPVCQQPHNLQPMHYARPDSGTRCCLTGNKNRAVRHTDMNIHSSRSHAMLQLWLEQRPAAGDDGPVVRSKLNFVDLAGSERWSKRHATTDNRAMYVASMQHIAMLCAYVCTVSRP